MNKLAIGATVTILDVAGYVDVQGEVILNERDCEKKENRTYLVRFVHPETNKFVARWFARGSLRKTGNRDGFAEIVMNATLWQMKKVDVESRDEIINQIIHCCKCLEKSKDLRTQLGELIVFLANYASSRDVSMQESLDTFMERNKYVKWQRTGKKGAPFKRVSDREDLAQRFCDFLQKKGLCETDCDAKVEVDDDGERINYFVLWSKTTGDGTKWTGQIDIYGEKFIKSNIYGRNGNAAWSRSPVLDMEEGVYKMLEMFLAGDIEGIDTLKQKENPVADID